MKNNRFLDVCAGIIWAAMLLAEVLMLTVVLKLNMLPGGYLAALIGVLAGLWLAVGGLMFLHGKKRKAVKTGRRMTALVLALLMVLGCGLGASVAFRVQDTVSGIGNTTEITTNMNVYVRREDPARTLEDTADYLYGWMDSKENEKARQAADRINEELANPLRWETYSVPQELIGQLLDGRLGAVIMSEAYLSILESNGIEGLENLSDRIRVLHQVSLTEQVTPPPRNPDPDAGGDHPAPGVPGVQPQIPSVSLENITERPFVVYISGSDARTQTLVTSNSDVNILAVVNPLTKQVLLVNTPRDYYIPNPAGNGALDKLTHCGCYGISCSIEALSDLYQEPIDYYGQISFTGFETLIDAVGGVVIYSDVSFPARDTFIEAGENYLNGAAALDYARERYHVAGGDNTRGKNQMKVIKAVIEKLASGQAIANYGEILNSLEGMFATSMTNQNIADLVKMQLSDLASWNVQTYAVDGTGGSDITYSIPGAYAYVTYPDEGMVEYGTELIDRVMAGEILTEQDVVYPG